MPRIDQSEVVRAGKAEQTRSARSAHNVPQTPAWSLVVASNDERVLRNTLLASPAIDEQCQIVVERDAPRAARAYNRGLDKAKSDIVVFAHQDVFLPAGWFANLRRAIDSIQNSGAAWGVLGVFGVAQGSSPAYRGFCYSTGLRQILGKPFSDPIEAHTLDELVLVVRRSSGLRFDERLPGFHLYGTDICMEAQAKGLGSYIVPAFCIHNSNGVVRMPSDFWRAYFYLRKKWWLLLPVATCCTRIARLPWPVVRRIAVEWKERLHPRSVGRRQSNVAALYRQLCESHPEVCVPPASVPHRMQIGVLGATLETPNLGVSVLATGAVKCALSAFPEARVFFLDYARESSAKTVTVGADQVRVPLVNMRFSKKFWLPNNIAMLLLAAIVLRLLPLRRVRSFLTRRNECLRQIVEADLYTAVAGGDSFSDIYGAGRFLYVALPQILVLLLGKRLALLPQTYGPFRRGWTRWVARWIVAHAERAWCRDRESLATLMGWQQSDESARHFCHDMGFAIDSHPPEHVRVDGFSLDCPMRSHLIGMNVSGLLFRGGYSGKNEFGIRLNYAELTHAIVDHLLADPLSHVLLVPHVYGTGQELESDAFACEQVYRHMHERYPGRLGILRGEYGPNEIRAIVGKCDFFIGARMHACIAAVSQCIPAVSVAYSDKFLGVMRSAGVGDLVADARTLSQEEILTIVSNGMRRRLEIARELQARMPAIRESVCGVLRAGALCTDLPVATTAYASLSD